MSTYLVIDEKNEGGFTTGILLGKKKSTNPEEALKLVCRDALSEFGIGVVNLSENPVPEVAIAFDILRVIDNSFTPDDIIIYRIADSEGGEESYTLDDLQFDTEEGEVDMEDIEIE